jgi:isoamylase
MNRFIRTRPEQEMFGPSTTPEREPALLEMEQRDIPRGGLVTARGQCRPYGATPQPGGVNFALFSRHAEAVHLLLFRAGEEDPIAELPLEPQRHRTGDVWHIFVHDLGPDTLYGYRVRGPILSGHRFNPRAVLIDPYALALSGGQRWGQPDGARPLATGSGHSGHARLPRRGRIIFDRFDWEDDVPPRHSLAETVVYELHVRGFTRHPSSGVKHPGTFLGLCEKIPYLKSLGVTAVQLMPILEFDELGHTTHQPHTGEPLRNYWGYSPLSFFAPKAGYAAEAGAQLRECKEMVKAFHKAGIEVILDVVYNHTAEGDDRGPLYNLRGLDNSIYYMLDQEGRHYNFSGCGNTLNCNHPVVRDLILDSLTYLVSELHVDGFRFDLAAILGRGTDGAALDEPPLLEHIAEHPVLAGTKLIAEAWDATASQLGKFPAWGRWAELNGWFRDDLRRFVRSEPGATAAVAKRICGSLDLYGASARHPHHSINFVTCHDGFTLHDLVSYNLKHNEANGENNSDGWNDNISFNCGVEGPSDNIHVVALRQRQMRNFLALLMLSQGVPLLLAGDEFGRTQKGNNNAYCQDNELSWVDWTLADKNAGLLRFTRMMIALRKRYFTLGPEQFVRRVTWHGREICAPDWTGQQRVLAMQLHGLAPQPDFYVICNAHWEWQRFELPLPADHRPWLRLVDTNLPVPYDIVEEKDAVPLHPGDEYEAAPRSAVMLIGPRR